MDALSDVLSAVRLDGAVYVNAEFTAPWCVATRYGLHTAAPKLPDTDHVVFFHLLTEGSCLARLAAGGEVVTVKAGDLLLLPHDDLHVLGSDLKLPFGEVRNAPPESGGLLELHAGGGGEATRFICGYLACDRRASRALLGSLPPMLRISLGDVSRSGWLADLLRVGVQESRAQRPGSQSLLAKLSELAFTEALRRYAQSNPPELKGWLAGLQDPYVGRALALLHGEPTRGWTVDQLAREVALSRSALAERFVATIGLPPMQYLTQWRLTLAAQTLRAGSESITRIAERSGYDSEAAFTRAFKREFGVPPTVWRKANMSGPAAAAEAVAREKGILMERLPRSGIGILNVDNPLIADMAKRTRARLLTFGRSPEADLRAFDISSDWPERMSMSVAYQGETVRVRTKLIGKHWVTSVLAAIGVGLACGIDLKSCAQIVERTDPVFGRYTVHTRDDGGFFVLDCHKAPYWTIVEGLTFVNSVSAPRKTIIFGTISDYPGAAGPRYRRVARDALEVADRVIFVGPHAGHIGRLLRRGIGTDRLFGFQTTYQASQFIDGDEIAGELIYVKGSVSQHLERIMLARLDEVVCWRETCGRKRACMSCQHFRTVQPLPLGMTFGTAEEHQPAL